MREKISETISLKSAVREDGAHCTVRGLRKGLAIDAEYLAHQPYRYLRLLRSDAIELPKPAIVFKRGFSSDRIRNSTVQFRIAFGEGGRFTEEQKRTAIVVITATFVRKYLEDKGIFVGSHTIEFDGKRVDETGLVESKARYLKASCGAYKIAEEADKSRLRTLAGTGKAVAEVQQFKHIAAEIVISRRPNAPRIVAQSLMKSLARWMDRIAEWWGILLSGEDAMITGVQSPFAFEIRLQGKDEDSLLSSAVLAESLVCLSLYDSLDLMSVSTKSRN